MSKVKEICILDYGSGNVRSVYNMINALGYKAVISNDSRSISNSSHLVLPGVGAFGAAMKKIKKTLPLDRLALEVLGNGKPLLGICVGMQVLMDEGFEYGRHAGLGWIPGRVEKIESGSLPLPHIGWNDVEVIGKDTIFNKESIARAYYFLHSYAVKPIEHSVVVGLTQYTEEFVSIIQKNNIVGVQFHPEKSQVPGMQLIKQFVDGV